MTTGMFPQEMVISIPEGRNINEIQLATTNGKWLLRNSKEDYHRRV